MNWFLRLLKSFPRLGQNQDCHPQPYDLFFSSFAGIFARKIKLESVYADFQNVHPLNYLRINTVLQQFDEFLDFYGIREGDGM